MLVLFLFFIIVVGLFGYMIGTYVKKKKKLVVWGKCICVFGLNLKLRFFMS